MRSGKSNQEWEEYEEDDFNSKKDGPSSNTSINFTATSAKDKSNDKANAMRSKHSVTEQRRRSKINERFQVLRDLIPNTDQKRDTASFLLEVIDYVKYLQEKVEKYEGSYPGYSPEPTKLMPWRHSHWRVPMKNGSGSVPTISGNFEVDNLAIASNVLATQPNTVDLESGQEVDHIVSGHEQGDGAVAYPPPPPPPPQRPGGPDSQSMECPITGDILTQQEDFSVEGGTISISSVYSQELLSTLTDSLQSAGVDLSQASISVQIDLGNRANIAPTTDSPHPGSSAENGSDQALKRQKT